MSTDEGSSTVSSSNDQASAGLQLLRAAFAAKLPNPLTPKGRILLGFTTNLDSVPENERHIYTACTALPVQADGQAYSVELRQYLESTTLTSTLVKILASDSDDGKHLKLVVRWQEGQSTPGLELIKSAFRDVSPKVAVEGDIHFGFALDASFIPDGSQLNYRVCETLPTTEDAHRFLDELQMVLEEFFSQDCIMDVLPRVLRRSDDGKILFIDLQYRWTNRPSTAVQWLEDGQPRKRLPH